MLPNTREHTQGGRHTEETKKHGPSERAEQTSRKELNEMEMSNLSDTECKTLVMRMLTELSGHCNSIKKTPAEMKAALSEIKKNLQGTGSGGDEAEIQINVLEHKEEKSIQSEQQEEKRIPKNEDGIRSPWDISKCTNIQIIHVPEGEEEEQEIDSLFEKIRKENFPNLVKEIDIQAQEAERVPNKLDPKRTTPRCSIIKMPKIKDKERILKTAREKQRVTCR